jgi:hypothetical protein
MRILAGTALVATALAVSPSSQTLESLSDSLERPFPSNGRISMDLSAGGHRITGSPDSRIRLHWTVRYASDLSKVKARADVNNSQARITTDGPSNNFKVDIQVPSRADLYIRLTAGELVLKDIEGNKDIESHAGEIDIDVGRAEDYNRVDASVWAGELQAAPYSIFKGGLFRSFDWAGKGRYRLHAKLKAGEIRLHSKSASN